VPNEPKDIHVGFFNDLGEALVTQEGIDTELAEILKRYLLKTHPDEDCVEKAQADLVELAANRAAKLREVNG
jgi:hypothetical protein